MLAPDVERVLRPGKVSDHCPLSSDLRSAAQAHRALPLANIWLHEAGQHSPGECPSGPRPKFQRFNQPVIVTLRHNHLDHPSAHRIDSDAEENRASARQQRNRPL